MTTTDSRPSTTGQALIEQRLDALDRALLGILPRNERLAFVTQVETRVRELADGNAGTDSIVQTAMDPEVLTVAASRAAAVISPKRRSRLALSSGILGIVALAMLFAMPITYVVVAFVGEGLGEFVSIGLLSIHVLAVAIGGLVAGIMGIAGLVSLARRKGRLVGHGWAITGLCTAPLPTFVGGLLVLVTGFSLFSVQAFTADSAPRSPVMATGMVPANYCPSEPGVLEAAAATSYAPAPSPPSNMPLRVSAAPTFCFPANDGPQCCPAPAPPAFFPIPAEVSSARPRDSYDIPPVGYAPAASVQTAPAAPAPGPIPAAAKPAPAAAAAPAGNALPPAPPTIPIP